MKALILSLSLLFSSPPCLQVDVLVIVDLSMSVQDYQGYMATATRTLVDRFELDEDGMKIGILGFSSAAWVFQDLTADKNKLNAVSSTIAIMTPVGNTDLTSALYLAIDRFDKTGRPGYRKMIVLISDGAPDSPDTAEQAMALMRSYGIHICGVLVNSFSAKTDFLERTCPCYVNTNFELLAEEMRKLDVCM